MNYVILNFERSRYYKSNILIPVICLDLTRPKDF